MTAENHFTVHPGLRRRLDIQGFEDLDDATLAQTQQWLRFAPATCAAVAAIGTAFALPLLLWALAVIAALGTVLTFHPFDLLYIAVRHVRGGPLLPANGAPRRFACGVGMVWLIATGTLFAAGYDLLAVLLGASFVAVATLIAATHICIPSMIFRTACGQMPSLRPKRL